MDEDVMLSEIISNCHEIYKCLSSLIREHGISEYDDDVVKISDLNQLTLNHAFEISMGEELKS